MESRRHGIDEWWDIRPLDGHLRLHVRRWEGAGMPFVLLHGLASNCRTWEGVASQLAAAGHPVVAVDQRGHGLSDKPQSGYDFATVADDLARLLDLLAISEPLVAGQSWGGNVALEFGVRYPRQVAYLCFVDGGYIDLQMQPEGSWEEVKTQLRPPDLAGMLRTTLKERIQAVHPDWSEEGVEVTLDNFEVLADGTVRPWLSLDRHMAILHALWEQRPAALYPQVKAPALIAAAEDRQNPAWMQLKHRQVAAAMVGLSQATVHWFEDTAHDIHVQRPVELAATMLRWARGGA